MDDEAALLREAHATLSKAISDYYAATSGEYCEAWVLVAHKRSIELEAENTSAVGVLTAVDQSWVLSRGMLEIARENNAFTGRQVPDDE